MSRITTCILLLLSLLILVTLAWRGTAAMQPAEAVVPGTPIQSSAACPSLPAPTGTIVNVSDVAQLQNAVANLTPGTTILLADGTYELHRSYLWFGVPGVAMRSASGNREAVVVDGNYETAEIVTIAASNVTIADLTLMRAETHPIHVVSSDEANTENSLIYNVHIIDPGQQAIKINPHEARLHFPDNGTVACSHIELSDAGRSRVWEINSSCYTGGVDGHQARGWVIRDNVIQGFWCENDLSEHAVHFWTGSRDTLVERNRLIDNARGVGFGLLESGDGRVYDDDPCPGAVGYVDHFDGIIRNNFIFAGRNELFSSEYGFDCGICLSQACGSRVLHNTVASTAPPFSSIEWRFSNTDAEIINNLASHAMQEREGAVASLAGNLENAPLSLFVNGQGGDLHLAGSASQAIDQGVSVAVGLCDDDIDGDSRPIGPAPDIGADEYGVPPPSAVTDLRLTQAITSTGTLTVILRWTAPMDAVTYTLRYSSARITEANWNDALAVSEPFNASSPGSTEWFTASAPYTGGMLYFALRTYNAAGIGSGLSKNVFWPRLDIYLPLVVRNEWYNATLLHPPR